LDGHALKRVDECFEAWAAFRYSRLSGSIPKEQSFEAFLFSDDARVSDILFVANSVVHAQVGRLLKRIPNVIGEKKIYPHPLGTTRVYRKRINSKLCWLILVGFVCADKSILETVTDSSETLVSLTPVKYDVLPMRRSAVSTLTTIWESFVELPWETWSGEFN
jgi:hypothetical protein